MVITQEALDDRLSIEREMVEMPEDMSEQELRMILGEHVHVQEDASVSNNPDGVEWSDIEIKTSVMENGKEQVLWEERVNAHYDELRKEGWQEALKQLAVQEKVRRDELNAVFRHLTDEQKAAVSQKMVDKVRHERIEFFKRWFPNHYKTFYVRRRAHEIGHGITS